MRMETFVVLCLKSVDGGVTIPQVFVNIRSSFDNKTIDSLRERLSQEDIQNIHIL